MKLFYSFILVFSVTITTDSLRLLDIFSSGNKHLILSYEKHNFDDAQKHCKDLGGFVPTPNEVDPQAFHGEVPNPGYWLSFQVKSDNNGSTSYFMDKTIEGRQADTFDQCRKHVCCVYKLVNITDPQHFRNIVEACDKKLAVVCGFDTFNQAQIGYLALKFDELTKNLSHSIAQLDEKIGDNFTEFRDITQTKINEAQNELHDLKNTLNSDKDELALLKSQCDEHRQAIQLDITDLKTEHANSVSKINARIDEATQDHESDVSLHYRLIDDTKKQFNEAIANLSKNFSNAMNSLADKHQLQNERLNDTLDNFKAQGMQLNKTVGHLSQEIVKISQNLTKIVEAIQNLTNIQVQDEPITDLKDANRIHEMMIYGIISFLAFSSILFILLKVVCVSCKRKKVKKEHSMKYSASQEQVEFVVDVKEAETGKSRNSLTRSDKSYQSNDMVHRFIENKIYEEPVISKDLIEEMNATHEEMTELKENE